MADGRRKSDSSSAASRPSEPAVQIRGFHVEGQQPQQLSPNALLTEMRSKGGSPAPVIVPPSFQVRVSAWPIERAVPHHRCT